MTLTIQPSVPTYEVYKVRLGIGQYWVLARTDQQAFIGKFHQRKQAIQTGRLLAGWRGQVVVRKG